MAISPQQLKIYLTSAHRAVIFAIAQLSCLFFISGHDWCTSLAPVSFHSAIVITINSRCDSDRNLLLMSIIMMLLTLPYWKLRPPIGPVHILMIQFCQYYRISFYIVMLRRGSTCPLSRAVDGCIPRHGIISSCQSAAASRIVKRCCSC